MPTVLRTQGFRVIIYTDDHAPPDVHAFHGGAEAVISIDDSSVRWSVMTEPRPRDVREIVVNHRDELLLRWEEIHNA